MSFTVVEVVEEEVGVVDLLDHLFPSDPLLSLK